jgi:hypothetical protein
MTDGQYLRAMCTPIMGLRPFYCSLKGINQTTRRRRRSLMKYKTHFYPDRIFLENISLLKKMSSSLQFETVKRKRKRKEKKRNGVNPWSFHT